MCYITYMISVALVDDHEVTRRGIKTVIELDPSIKVIIESGNGMDFLGKLATTTILPDVAILDISMPVMNGFETLDILQKKYPSIRIIVFSLLYEEYTVINMISRGACGFINKSADPSILAKAITLVHNEGFYRSGLAKNEYFQKSISVKNRICFQGKENLTTGELIFIKLAATDLTYKEIAEKMKKRPKTIENYRDKLFIKLNIKNRSSLVAYGYKIGLLEIQPDA